MKLFSLGTISVLAALYALAWVTGCTPEKPVATTSVEATSPSEEELQALHERGGKLIQESEEQLAQLEQIKRDAKRYDQMSRRCLAKNEELIDPSDSECKKWIRDRSNGGYYEVQYRICIENQYKTETAAKCEKWLTSTKPGGYKDSGN
jgi:hypothetical protein